MSACDFVLQNFTWDFVFLEFYPPGIVPPGLCPGFALSSLPGITLATHNYLKREVALIIAYFLA